MTPSVISCARSMPESRSSRPQGWWPGSTVCKRIKQKGEPPVAVSDWRFAVHRRRKRTAQKGVDDFLLGAAVQTDDGVILSSLWDPRKFVPPVRYIKKNMPAMFKPPVKKPKIA
ncbi:hypothetical protein [Ruthenibacterium lactatiformans]|uniref:hypothetical protein n=1 Tax=Ruthenibacterium lactatiformans TaxID=1550024 RepID=UPI00196795FB|nr:hypothetical protein [Ruthenibacterium lactatiformans]MBN3031680.1 hypothetical protein [Ruthenibacterium lactatiformans]